MPDSPEVEKKLKKRPIWICAEVWLGIFPFLAPRQLGLRIALVGDRFDRLVAGHFRTRKWTFGHLEIRGKIGKDCGTKEMKIVKMVNSSWKPMPIPEERFPLLGKTIGFKHIEIKYIDQNVVAFLRRIRRLFDSRGTDLAVVHIGDSWDQRNRISTIILHRIWPLIRGNVRELELYLSQFKHLRLFAPTILSDCPNLKAFVYKWVFPNFPADDSFTASNSHAVAKWLCTPRADGVPKVLKCQTSRGQYPPRMEAIKREFASASSVVNFIIVLCVPSSFLIVPFYLINELTGECLTMKRFEDDREWLLVRCPISRDEKQWAEWEKEAIERNWMKNQWNKLVLSLNDDAIADGLFSVQMTWVRMVSSSGYPTFEALT